MRVRGVVYFNPLQFYTVITITEILNRLGKLIVGREMGINAM